jgi:hypothetical protein
MSKAIPSRSSARPRKGYASPKLTQLDAETAKARLIEEANPSDPAAKKMLSLIDDQLAKRAKSGS